MNLLKKFERDTTQVYIPEIDVLRFIAIITVMLLHFNTAFFRENTLSINNPYDHASFFHFINLGSGVNLFFAISGFILALPFLKKGKVSNLKRYFQRRIMRIEPPYLIALTLFFVLHIFLETKELPELANHYFASLAYSHNYIYKSWSLILPVAWSLEIEAQFYILMPVFLFLILKLKSIYLRILFYIFFVILSLMYDFFEYKDLNDYMAFFICGMASADFYVNIRLGSHWAWSPLFLFSLVLFYWSEWPLVQVISLLLLFMSSLNAPSLGFFLKNRVLASIGAMCYSLYLLHYPFYYLLMKLFSNPLTLGNNIKLNFLIQGCIFIPLSIAIISLFYLWVEKPFMKARLSKKPT
ncbi:MAG: peptidoglycan/LPS O-acetylase OafA/YrhL [Psychroserpens sp.]|jgi:peptidoglycan/LPS O-acetylase OafA/YrhL